MRTLVIACKESGFPDNAPQRALVVDELCRDPSQISSRTDSDRLVLLLHRDRFDLSSVQRAVRPMGIDPLGVQIYQAGSSGYTTLTPAGLDGLIARASTFEKSKPEQAKPVLPTRMTRRSFLYPPTPEYIAAPFIDSELCAASSGCKACVISCPRAAYDWQEGEISYDLDACAPCGVCITACPTGAISNPSVLPSMLKAQVDAIVGGSDHSVSIRFICSRGQMGPQDGIEDVVVPCTSMVPVNWILACLFAGCRHAFSVPCGDSGCPLNLDWRAIRVNRLAASLLENGGLRSEDVATLVREAPFDGFTHGAAAEMTSALAMAAGRPLRLLDDSAPLGVVEISADSCTLCGQCAKVCPTGSLMEVYDDENVMISFDPRLCVNCSQCTTTCPEFERGAIRVEGRFDSEVLGSGVKTLVDAPVASCDICGEAFAPTAMLGRVAELLGPEFGTTLKVVGSRCLDCRGR